MAEWVYIAIIIVLLVSAVGFLCYGALKDKKEEKEQVYATKGMKKSRVLEVFDFLENNRITGRLVRQAARNYEIIYPADRYNVAKATIRLIIITYIVSFASFSLIFLLKLSLLSFLTAVLITYVIINEIFTGSVLNADINLLTQFEKFISMVRKFYNEKPDIELAIWDAMNNTSKAMKVHANLLYEVLISDSDKFETRTSIIQTYNDRVRNKYMKMLLSICLDVQENGDKRINNSSLFLDNISEIKKAARIEKRRLEKNIFLFSGFVLVTVAPIVALPYITNWGIYISPEKSMFYRGMGGFLVSILAFIATLCCYCFIANMKDEDGGVKRNYKLLYKLSKIPGIKQLVDGYLKSKSEREYKQQELLRQLNENYGPRELLVKRIMYSFFTLVIGIFVLFYGHSLNKNYLLANSESIGENALGFAKGQITKMKEDVLVIVNDMKDKANVSVELVTEYTYQYTSGKKNVMEETIKEAYERIVDYQSEYIKFEELIGLFVCSVIAYFVPYILLLDKKRLINDVMHEEVLIFQTIISMRKDSPSCNTYSLLSNLESFAKVFKKSIQKCLVNYNIDDQEALETLRDRESYEPFKRIVDCFIRTDNENVSSAFAELASDRKNDIDDKNQELEMALERKLNRGTILAFIPSVIIIGGYLILPLLINAVQKLEEYNTMMNGTL